MAYVFLCLNLVSCSFKWESLGTLKLFQVISWELSVLVLSQWVQRKIIQKYTQGRPKLWPEAE